MIHILLAEDNEGDVLLVQQALEEYQIRHSLHVVEDGGKALEYLARMGKADGPPCPDIILIDVNLPKVDGPQVLREFRKRPECAETPVIVVSSSDAAKDRERMAQLGITRYFRKPLDFDAFLKLGALVREVIDEALISTSSP